jgi:sugar-specific transcriptional regulator TrmB
MITDDNIQTVIDFGLSYVQSLTYLTLVTLKKSDAKTIAKVSKVARQDIYQIMPALQKMGLVEKTVGVPTMYRAIPINRAVSLFLENKKKQYANLEEKTYSLINDFPENEISALDNKDQFVLISELSLLLNLHETLTTNCERTLDIMMPLVKHYKEGEEWRQVNELFRQKKEVKKRLITEQPNDPQAYIMFWNSLINKPYFEVKYVQEPVDLYLFIFDEKQFTLSVGTNNILPSLWSNNPNALKLAINYFNSWWCKNPESKI